jgi:PAS domain S-box-containing protein
MDFIERAAVPLHWAAEDGTILWANEAELGLLGYSREEFVERNIREFHIDEAVINDILYRLKRNEVLHKREARMRCKDGSIRYVVISSSVYRKDGRFIHTRCVTLDVTEHKKRYELQERLAAIVESSDDAIISKDLNGVVRSWNAGAERLFGYTSDEMIGKPITTIIPRDRLDEELDILRRLRCGQRVDHFETTRKTKDGALVNVSLTISPMKDAQGQIVGASKIARDITERQRHEKALRDANAALLRANADLQQFAYSASHDLQEPLRTVATYSEQLHKEFGGQLGPNGDEYIRYTIQGAERMEHLLRALRDYALTTSVDHEPAEETDAGQSLDKALAALGAVIKANGAEITRTALPCVRIHDVQLVQLFQNLISNAIRYRGSKPPRIHIAVKRRGADWLFSIQDNGIGIDPKYKEQIFELFKRLHTATEYPGTGMGLAICQRIVERVGGRIWVESAPGNGSTFFFTIPSN